MSLLKYLGFRLVADVAVDTVCDIASRQLAKSKKDTLKGVGFTLGSTLGKGLVSSAVSIAVPLVPKVKTNVHAQYMGEVLQTKGMSNLSSGIITALVSRVFK